MYVHIYRRNTCQESSYILQLHLEFCIVSDEAIPYTRLHKNMSWFCIVTFGEMTPEMLFSSVLCYFSGLAHLDMILLDIILFWYLISCPDFCISLYMMLPGILLLDTATSLFSPICLKLEALYFIFLAQNVKSHSLYLCWQIYWAEGWPWWLK